MAVAENS